MPGRSEDVEGTLTPPASGVWEQLGLTVVGELSGGHQSRVVLVHRDEEQLVIKLTDARLVDLHDCFVRIIANLPPRAGQRNRDDTEGFPPLRSKYHCFSCLKPDCRI